MTSVSEDRQQQLSPGLAIKTPCLVATVAPIALSGLLVIDGIQTAANDRVLVKNQANSADNGIYVVSSGSWSRSSDMDGTRDAVDGTIVIVRQGTGAFAFYKLNCATNPPVIGTTALTFTLSGVADSSNVIFLQAGAGATQRSSRDKMRDWISVKDFGAVGDGVTDDSVAIQAAVDAVLLASPYGCLLFPRGTYLVNAATITINGPLYLKGMSRDGGSIIKTTTNARNPFLATTGTAGQVYGVVFEDLSFMGPGAGSTNSAVIFQHAWACLLNRCHVEGWKDGISLRPGALGSMAVDDFAATYCRFEGNNTTDVDAQSRTGNMLLLHNAFGSSCPIGVKIIDCAEPRLISNNFRGIYTTCAIDIDEQATAVALNAMALFQNNHFEFQAAGTNIRVGNTRVINGIEIKGNTFAGAAAVQPVTLTRANSARVVGNLAYNWATGTSIVSLGAAVTDYTEENNSMNVAAGGAHGSGTPTPSVRIGNPGSQNYRQLISTNYFDFRILNDLNSTSHMLEFGYTGSAFASAVITDGPTGETAFFTTGDAHPLIFGVNNRMVQYFDSAGGVHWNAEDGLTAHAGGGQAAALQLAANRFFHRISVVAAGADSVKLPPATFGLCHVVKNSGANAMQVFGTNPDTIDGAATAVGVSVPAGKGAMFFCTTAGAWYMLLGA